MEVVSRDKHVRASLQHIDNNNVKILHALWNALRIP